jgi:hypothetical protein
VAKLLKSLVLMICPFFLLESIPKVLKLHPEGSSSSIWELWPDIDKLEEIQHEDTFVLQTHDVPVRGRNVVASTEKADMRSRCGGDETLLNDAPGPSNIKSKGRVSGSVRKEAAQILSAAPGAISPCVCEGRL